MLILKNPWEKAHLYYIDNYESILIIEVIRRINFDILHIQHNENLYNFLNCWLVSSFCRVFPFVLMQAVEHQNWYSIEFFMSNISTTVNILKECILCQIIFVKKHGNSTFISILYLVFLNYGQIMFFWILSSFTFYALVGSNFNLL